MGRSLKGKNKKIGTARKIIFNFASLITSEVISKVIQLAIFVYLARVLGKNDFGIFSFGLAFAFIVVLVSDFGLNHYFVREISRNKALAGKFFANAFKIKILLSIATVALSFFAIYVLGYEGPEKNVALIMIFFAIFQSFNELNFSMFRAFEKMHFEMIIKVIRMIILASLVFLRPNGLFAVSLAFMFNEIAILIISSAIVHFKFAKITNEFDWIFSRRMIKTSLVFFFSTVFANIYLYIDQILLSKLKSPSDVGLYSAAANIAIALIFIPAMYGNSIYPVLSKLYVNSKNSMKLAYEKSFKYMFILGLAAAVGMYTLSEKIALFLYGSEYILSGQVLAILAGFLFLKFLNPISGFTLMATNRQGSRLFSQAVAAFLNIILNLILIPYYGIIGAAYATLITEIVFFCLYSSFISKLGFSFKFLLDFMYKPVIASIAMFLVIRLFDGLFIPIIAGALTYFAILYLLGTIDKEDRFLFEKIIKNR